MKETERQSRLTAVQNLEEARAAAGQGPGTRVRSAEAVAAALQVTYAKQENAKWETEAKKVAQKANRAANRIGSLIGRLATPEGPKPKELAKIVKAYADVIRAIPPPQE